MSKFLQNAIANSFGKNPGKVVVYTSTVGWILSALAQISAIVLNDKLEKEQKMFMIPQEFADACFNISSFFVITSTLTALTEKLVKSGKWITRPIKDALIKNGLGSRIGDPTFNILTEGNLSYKLKRSHILHRAGMGIIAANVGSVLSCNIVTPLLRNLYASKRQEQNIARMKSKNPPEKPKIISYMNYKRPSMQTFINNSSLKI